MLIYGQIKQVREAVKEWKREGKSVGFVPTMGYLDVYKRQAELCDEADCYDNNESSLMSTDAMGTGVIDNLSLIHI